MPSPALSLFGFLDEATAVQYLRNACVINNAAETALRRLWSIAHKKASYAMPRAGYPDIQDIPSQYQAYLQGVLANPRFNDTVNGRQWSFKLVEIDPLLAYQFHIEIDRSAQHCRQFTMPPHVEDMLPVCLPYTLEQMPIQIVQHPMSLLIKSQSLNLRMFGAGRVGGDAAHALDIAGIVFGAASPLIHVVRFDGRCYLANGFHRAYGLRQAGATHMPCLLLEASDFTQTGAIGGGATFDQGLLESAAAPTVGHFTQKKAVRVTLKRMTRIITVSWSEYVFPDEI